MSKEIQLLKSKMEFYKRLINELDVLNFRTKSNKYDKIIEDYQNKLSEVYKRFQDLKEENKWKSKYQYFTIKIKNMLMII